MNFYYYHGTENNISGNLLEPRNPTINWDFSNKSKLHVKPSISLYDTKKAAKEYYKNIYRISGNFNLLSLINEPLSVNAKKYLRINNKDLKNFSLVRSMNDWVTSQNAYDFLKKNNYDGVIVWDAGNIGENIEIRLFKKIQAVKI